MIVFMIVMALVIALILIRTPIPFAFGGGALLFAVMQDRDISFLVTHSFNGLSGYALLAIPLFIGAGALMSSGGIAARLLEVVEAAVGDIRGGLGAVAVIVCAFFGAISGSATAAIAAIGPILMPKMIERGYRRDYVVALMSVSAILAMLIPPSILMIIFAVTANVSVAACFLSTLIPGVILTVWYVLVNTVWARLFLPKEQAQRVTLPVRTKRTLVASKRAILALLLPLVVLGGIYGGFFTPTEAAAVAFVYSLLVGALAYRELNFRDTLKSLADSSVIIGAAAMVLFFLLMMSRVLTLDRIPAQIADGVLMLSDNPALTLILINVVLLGIGMVMDDVSGILLAAIILLPIAREINVDPVHFAAIVGVNLGAGNVTPPCAPLLYLAGNVGQCEVHEYMRTSMVLLALGHIPMIFLVTFFPRLSLWLPSALLG